MLKTSIQAKFFLLFLLTALFCKPVQAQLSFDGKKVPPIKKSLASKPPMGWNSWDCLGWGATEQEVKAAADYMAKNLKHLGYEYIVIDMLWYGDEAAISFEDFVHETIPTTPTYNIDKYARLWPDHKRFPSSTNARGFKPLADYIHGLGLKFGLHLLRGIPWQVKSDTMIIKNTNINAMTIAQPDKGCEWYDGFYGVDMTKKGAQEYYNSVFELYAQWGVDFVKADDISNVPELEAMGTAARLSGRDIVLSVVPNDLPIAALKANAHMSRTGADFWDVWEMLKKGFPVAATAVKNAEPGFWPDLDMLPVGKLGLKISYKGPNARISNFTKDELHTLLTLWYISRMPLMIGGYLPQTDTYTLQLLQNKEALEVNRNSSNNKQIKFRNAHVIWMADIPKEADTKYLAFFNQWESKEPIKPNVTWQELGLSGKEYKVRDLWAKKDLGTFKDGFSYPVNAHGAGLFKIYK
jgi:alpha-galactosidase